MSEQEVLSYLVRCLGEQLDAAAPEPISGWRAVELLWPLRDVFRAHVHQIRTIRYDGRFEPEADQAVLAFVLTGASAWEAISPGCWRVLLERYEQLLLIALTNEYAGNPIMVLPVGLSEAEQRAALMLDWLRQTTLRWPVADRARLEYPEGPPPESMRRH